MVSLTVPYSARAPPLRGFTDQMNASHHYLLGSTLMDMAAAFFSSTLLALLGWGWPLGVSCSASYNYCCCLLVSSCLISTRASWCISLKMH